MVLSEVKIGERVKIIVQKNENAVKQRLRTMGIRSGTIVTVMNTAPFETPIEIKIGNFRLAICKAEADKIVVEYV